MFAVLSPRIEGPSVGCGSASRQGSIGGRLVPTFRTFAQGQRRLARGRNNGLRRAGPFGLVETQNWGLVPTGTPPVRTALARGITSALSGFDGGGTVSKRG